MRYSFKVSFIFLLSLIMLKSCQKPDNQLSISNSLAQSTVFLESTIESSTLKQVVFADSLFHMHHLTDALSAYTSINSKRSTTINSYITFRSNEIKQKLNTHLVYLDTIFNHSNILMNSNSGSLDSILYFLDEINLYNPIDISIFESLAQRTIALPSIPAYWKAKINLILGEYYFYEVNDLYKAYSCYTLANTQFESLDYPTHESIYLKKDLIQLTVGQREYLLGRKYGEDMIRLSQTYFPQDTILAVISNYMSGYIDRLIPPDSLFVQKYNHAVRLVAHTSYKKLHQASLNSFIYSIRGRSDTLLLDSLTKQLHFQIEASDTLVNIYKTKAEEFYQLKNYSKTIEYANKAILFLARYKRYTPPIYLTLTSILIDSYRKLSQFDKSNKEAYNNINFRYPFKCQNFKDIFQGKADYGYYNFIIIGDFIQNLYLEYIKTKNLDNLNQAHHLITKANELIDKENYSIEENRRLDMLDYSKSIYQSAMHVYYELYDKSRNKNYLESFFYYQEKTKANILYAESVELREKFKIPNELIQFELSLKEEIRKYRMNFSNISYVDVLYKRYDSLNQVIKLKYPDFYSARVSGSIKKLKDIKIADSILFASYSIFDQTIYSAFISDSIWINKKEFNLELEKDLDSLINYQMLSQTTHKAYQRLTDSIVPLFFDTQYLNGKKVILISPAGKINGLNPSILRVNSFSGYLGDNFNIFYAFSASSMNLDGINVTDTGKITAFSFSDLETIRNPSLILPELPGAYQEVNSISKKGDQNMIYTGLNATKQNFIKAYCDTLTTHLYLAVHGVAISSIREGVYLVFRTGNYRKMDTLYGYELIELFSSIPLITLASCKSASGFSIENEGVYNLVRYLKLNGANIIKANFGNIQDLNPIAFVKFI